MNAELTKELQEAAETVQSIQDACNIGGVMIAFAAAVRTLQKVARETEHGTDWINQHPIVRMYVSKLIHLSQFDNGALDYSKASDVVEALAKGDFTHINVQA